MKRCRWGCLALLALLLCGACGALGEEAPAWSGGAVWITEACADNDFVWTLNFEDYLELYNPTDAPVALGDFSLQVKKKTVSLPDVTLEPGAYYVLICDGKTAPALSKQGCEVRVLDERGKIVDEAVLPASKKQVWLRDAGLGYIPSPGYANTAKGQAAWYASVRGDLIISEALCGNFLALWEGERFTDAVELYNGGSAPVRLSDYYLSDDKKELDQFRLPSVTLQPGEYYLVYCTEEQDAANHAGFKLSSSGEAVYLSRGGKTVTDALNIPPLGLDRTYGRKDSAAGYFITPTLGSANGRRYDWTAEKPVFSVASSGGHRGAFQVEIQGEGAIYYTTDGSMPTLKSEKYAGPLTIRENTTLRAIAAPGGQGAPSAVATAEYRFDTAKYALPTVMVAVDQDYLRSSRYGLLNNTEDRDLEVPATVTFLNEDGTLKFSQDCGFSIAGQTSRPRANRGWKVSFRGKYGKDTLDCQVFEDFDCASFDSLVFRLGTTGDPLHDILGTAVGAGEMEDVLYQHYRPVNLFIGGTFYGVFALREHVNANFIVNHLGGDEDEVDMVYLAEETKLGSGSDWLALVKYCRTHDLSDPACYAYVAERVNVNSFMDYFIWRPYTGDSDHPNIRYVRSRAGGDTRWHIVIYDMDWAFQKPEIGMNKYTYALYDEPRHNNVVIYSLLKNPDFRREFLERLSYHMQHTFDPQRVLGLLNDWTETVRPDMPATQKKWGLTMSDWELTISGVKSFIRTSSKDRRTLLLRETQAFFKLTKEDMQRLFPGLTY